MAIRTIQKVLGGLDGVPVLVLGLTYREGVHELAYSRALPLIERLAFHGAAVTAYDPLLSGRRDRALLRDSVALGRAVGRAGDRHPDRRSAVPRPRPVVVPRPAPALRRPQLAARRCRFPTASRTTASASRPRRRRRVAVTAARRRAGRDRAAGAADVRIATVVGTRPQLIKLAALQPALRARHTRSSSTPASTGTRRWPAPSSRSSGCRGRTTRWASAAAAARDQTGRMLVALEPILDGRAARRGPRRRRHELDAGGRAGRGQARASRSRTWRPACAASTGACPKRSTASSPTTSRAGCSRRRRPPSPTWRPRVSPTASCLVGDLMQDLAARIAPEVRDAVDALRALPAAAGRPEPGRYLFATIHRAENREPAAIAEWAALLRAVATPARPVVLALHPGTRAGAGGDRRRPRAGRPRHRAAGLPLLACGAAARRGGPDRFGRRPARGRVARRALPRPAGPTEWVEAVAGSDGRMAARRAGRRTRAVAALARVAPEASAPEAARRRAPRPSSRRRGCTAISDSAARRSREALG